MNLNRKLKFNNKQKALSIILFLAALVLFLPQAAHADWVTTIIGGLASGIASVLGWILAKVMAVLVYVAQYNNFINSAAIVNGWVIARDISNMFFVIILLVIAFGTILRLENYSYKKWLPKLILMAILINFSKTICGLLIDVAQVVMLTFVNAFKDVMAGSFVEMLGITGWQKLDGIEDVSSWEVAGAYVLSVIYSAIALITVTAMLGMLVMRIIMIWVYVVLSPFAYLLAAFPGGSKYSSMWWSDFTKNLIVGPVLAFFIWLSFTSLASFNNNATNLGIDGSLQDPNEITCQKDVDGVCEKGTTDIMIKFVISIAMLLGGMKIAQEIGGAAAGVAGKISSAGNKLAIGAAAGAGYLVWKGVQHPASWANDKFLQKKGIADLNLKRVYSTWQARRKDKKGEEYAEGLVNAGKNMDKGGVRGLMAMTAGPSDAYDKFTDWKGLKPVGIIKQLRGGKGMDARKDVAGLVKERVDREFGDEEFKLGFMNATPAERKTMTNDAAKNENKATQAYQKEDKTVLDITDEIRKEKLKGDYKDTEKIEKLTADKKQAEINREKSNQEMLNWNGRNNFAKNNLNKTFTPKETFESRAALKEKQKAVDKAEQKIADNIPSDNRQARIAEQTIVSKKVGELKEISDPSELLRMLKTSISTHDKTMVKAIMLKLSKDGNDNEALQSLAGRTDHIGLKDLMRQFSDKKSNNYAGFHEQESFALGSQIAEINKSTNHWGATSAYLMDNGKWRETTNKEHHEIRDVETGKQQLQAFIRNNNRLAYGYHDETGKFHLDAGGVIKLKAINSAAGHKNIETMNESAAEHVYKAIKENPKLEAMFSQKITGADGKETNLLGALENRLGKISGDIEEKLEDAENDLVA
ncbi:MAG TPA: hypothetical protein VFD16_02740 [Candidatus Saccharimonadales bacterium]|nr:hypothetical protein [Candidatus Saccharimonadales bacterium]